MTSHILVLSRRSGLCAAGFLSLCMLVSACGGGGGGGLAAATGGGRRWQPIPRRPA